MDRAKFSPDVGSNRGLNDRFAVALGGSSRIAPLMMVPKEQTGKETETWEIIYFKLYQSQNAVVGVRLRQRPRCWEAIDREATVWR